MTSPLPPRFHSASRSPCRTPALSHATTSHPNAPSWRMFAPVSHLHLPELVRLPSPFQPPFSLILLFFFSSKFLLVHVALVQLFRVSVSTSANSSSGGGMAVGSYARPLGATLIAFGIAVLVTGEFVTPFPFPLPLPFSLFLDTIHIAAQANALTGRSPSQVLFDISPSSARCHRDCSLLHV